MKEKNRIPDGGGAEEIFNVIAVKRSCPSAGAAPAVSRSVMIASGKTSGA